MAGSQQVVSEHVPFASVSSKREHWRVRGVALVNQTIGDSATSDILQQDSAGAAVKYRASGDVEETAVANHDGCFAIADLVDVVATDRTASAAIELNSQLSRHSVAVVIAWISIKHVARHHDRLAISSDEVARVSFPDCVASDRDTTCVRDINIHLNIRQHIVRNGNVAVPCFLRERSRGTFAVDANVGRIRSIVSVLNGATYDGDLAD